MRSQRLLVIIVDLSWLMDLVHHRGLDMVVHHSVSWMDQIRSIWSIHRRHKGGCRMDHWHMLRDLVYYVAMVAC